VNPVIAATMALAMGGELFKVPQMFALQPRTESRSVRFPERKSYRTQVRDARIRRNVQKRGGAR